MHGIVRRLKGGIGLNTQQDKGSIFSIYLPSAPNEEVKKSKPLQQYSMNGQKKKVLVIHDEPMVVEAICDYLVELGFETEFSLSGLEGLEKFRRRQSRYDLVSVDLSMPRMDGISVVNEIRKINPTIPIVLVSGYATRDFSQILDEKTRFASKPFDYDVFERTLSELLELS